MIAAFLQLLKCKHYIKNLVVLLPLVFLDKVEMTQAGALKECIMVFIGFCLMSSAVYIFNDIRDVELDKKHPIKKLRPLASQKISIKQAYVILAILLIIMLIISQHINKNSNMCIWSYLGLNILYSLRLKRYKLIDMGCIATGFVLRILSGIFVSSIPSPKLMIIVVFFVSMFFSSAKRISEYKLLADENNRRKSLRNINLNTLNWIFYMSGALSVVIYSTLIFTCREEIAYPLTLEILFTCIVFRFLYMVKKHSEDEPMSIIEQDNTIKILITFFIATILCNSMMI